MRGAAILLALATVALGAVRLGMTGHMVAHMAAVAVAAPIVALALPGNARTAGPLGWAAAEFAVVWTWHAPMLRDLADGSPAIALAEQAMFLTTGVGLWRAALASPAAGAGALLVTSMHMTLLGALIALAPRPLYTMMAMHPAPGLDALADQQLGGAAMLAIGGAAYLLGGLFLLSRLLRSRAA